MADPNEDVELPQATPVAPKRSRLSIVWIIPVLAVLVGVGLAVQRIRSEGPTITIVFKAAEGIEAGKTFIKYKDVIIGQVKTVQFTEDYANVEVTAKITKRAAGLMVDDAQFWVVRPTISLSGISGLNTLLSGNYIGFQAGTSPVERSEFVGLDKAPFVAGQLGREFTLKASDLGSLAAGSPVYYRRLPVGQVIGFDLTPDGKSVDIQVFVTAPYDKFVSLGTRFWRVSGIDVTFDANGLDVRTESLAALLVGGLAFDAPPFLHDTTVAPPDAVFQLYDDRAKAMKARDALTRQYVLRFNESLRGLNVGAPVTYLGVQIGEVVDIGFDFEPEKANIVPRVTITFYPERLLTFTEPGQQARVEQILKSDDKRRNAFLQRMIDERGLRAQLRTGSLLTGQLYVAFDYFPKAARASITWNRGVAELPVVPSGLVDLEAKLASILEKIDKLPLDQIAGDLRKDLQSLDETLNGANKLITRVDKELVPSLKTSLEGLQRALAGMERTLKNADASLLGPDAPAQQELRDALTEFTRAARSMRVFLDYLERHPESPIRGKLEDKRVTP
ncbi:MAG TPA: MlaD family protein [Casimicrobiaceae bacterium]|jgi:paraquat-inducible protein B|nr:MlaD family protein [Casimicrobiaceae bacterium]